VLESSKSAVLVEAAKVEKMAIAEEAKEKLLLRASGGLSFFNTSPMDLSTLGELGIKANLERYIQCFSKDASEIFDHFKFAEFIGLLNDANLLYKFSSWSRIFGKGCAAFFMPNHGLHLWSVIAACEPTLSHAVWAAPADLFAARGSKNLAVSMALIFSAMATTKNGFMVVSSAVAMRLAACLSDSGRLGITAHGSVLLASVRRKF